VERQDAPALEKDVHIWRLCIPATLAPGFSVSARGGVAGLSPSASPEPFLQNNDTTRRVERLHDWLSPEERDRAARYHFEVDRRRFAETRGMLRLLLGHYAGCAPADVRFETGPMGKLHLPPPFQRIRFNVSHSHEWALIALALDRDVGVDVEHHRPLHHDLFAIATRFFAPAEVEALRALEPAQQQPAFYRIWSRKEAFIKATGQGVSAGLDTFSVSSDTGPAVTLRVFGRPDEEARWTMRSLDMGPDYGAAVAVEGKDFELRLWEWGRPSP